MKKLESLPNEFCLDHCQRLRPTEHVLIIGEIKSRAVAIEAARPRVDEAQNLVKFHQYGKKCQLAAQKNGEKASFFGAEPGPVAKIQTCLS